MAFGRALPEILPAFGIFRPSDDLVKTLLVVQGPQGKADESDLAVIGRQGGIVSPGYGYFRDPAFLRTRWFINPFSFFSSVFATDALPKRSEEHTSELQSLMRISYAFFCLKK